MAGDISVVYRRESDRVTGEQGMNKRNRSSCDPAEKPLRQLPGAALFPALFITLQGCLKHGPCQESTHRTWHEIRMDLLRDPMNPHGRLLHSLTKLTSDSSHEDKAAPQSHLCLQKKEQLNLIPNINICYNINISWV